MLIIDRLEPIEPPPDGLQDLVSAAGSLHGFLVTAGKAGNEAGSESVVMGGLNPSPDYHRSFVVRHARAPAF